MLVVQRVFRAKRTNLHEKYDYPKTPHVPGLHHTGIDEKIHQPVSTLDVGLTARMHRHHDDRNDSFQKLRAHVHSPVYFKPAASRRTKTEKYR